MRFLACFVLLFMLAACGQKGPLSLRESPPPGVKPAKPKPYEPVPYPPDTREEEK